MEIIHSLMSRLGAEGTAGFFIITGCLCAVAAFMAITGLRERKAPSVCLVLAVLYGAVLVTVPALLLVPFVMGGAFRGFYIIAFLVYVAMLMVKIASRFPASPGSAARLVLLPWAFALVHVLVNVRSAGSYADYMVLEYLATGLISFTSFWISFPFLFFGKYSVGRSSSSPMKAPLLLAILLAVLACGAVLVLHAWMTFYAGEVLSLHSVVPGIGIAVSVAMEVIDYRKFFGRGMM